MARKLIQFKALTMDCYGTLIDWESGIWDALQPLLHFNNRRDITRRVAMEAYAVIESLQQVETPDMIYPEILQNVHMAFARQFNLETEPGLNEVFGNSVPHWPAFRDAADALRQLQQHFKLVIISNIDNQSFAASNKKLGVTFDAVYTAQDMGAYKPTPANFDYMLKKLKADHNIYPATFCTPPKACFMTMYQPKTLTLPVYG